MARASALHPALLTSSTSRSLLRAARRALLLPRGALRRERPRLGRAEASRCWGKEEEEEMKVAIS
jgi:hypothetical protein